MTKLQRKTKIVVFVEGQTEEYYFKEFIKDKFDDSFNFDINNIGCGNYSRFLNIAEQYKGVDTPLLIVVNLDRTIDDEAEYKYLHKLCNAIKHTSKYSNIFLTYKNFETFLSAHFKGLGIYVKF